MVSSACSSSPRSISARSWRYMAACKVVWIFYCTPCVQRGRFRSFGLPLVRGQGVHTVARCARPCYHFCFADVAFNSFPDKQLAAFTTRMVTRDVLESGLRLITERIPHVRSVSTGVWLTRGSRNESEAQSGIAHVVEHMLFKGTATRTAEDIAQEIDSIGGQLDAFTAKEYASYYIKVLDEH